MCCVLVASQESPPECESSIEASQRCDRVASVIFPEPPEPVTIFRRRLKEMGYVRLNPTPFLCWMCCVLVASQDSSPITAEPTEPESPIESQVAPIAAKKPRTRWTASCDGLSEFDFQFYPFDDNPWADITLCDYWREQIVGYVLQTNPPNRAEFGRQYRAKVKEMGPSPRSLMYLGYVPKTLIGKTLIFALRQGRRLDGRPPARYSPA